MHVRWFFARWHFQKIERVACGVPLTETIRELQNKRTVPHPGFASLIQSCRSLSEVEVGSGCHESLRFL
jgi:hypothetical protein